MFGLPDSQIGRRIKRAAAGLGNGFSGHSPRVGMPQDLVAAGAELPGLMPAVRWQTSAIPALYTRNHAAGRGVVGRYYTPEDMTSGNLGKSRISGSGGRCGYWLRRLPLD